MSDRPAPTPCIHVCEMDAEGLCRGCHRTAAEICRWPGALGGGAFGQPPAGQEPGSR
ncbi:MAG TPA: DUF1289 domain-containing protein [Holophagaceae bacterium]|nr:DUF1289 domain-containing protein [Holophagaceae bacterium]